MYARLFPTGQMGPAVSPAQPCSGLRAPRQGHDGRGLDVTATAGGLGAESTDRDVAWPTVTIASATCGVDSSYIYR